MSKSTYDEAIKNTKILLALVNVKDLISMKKHDLLTQVEQSLKQAQKQEQLLELYKELAKVRDDMLDACEIVDDDYYDIRTKETYLKEQIKELEEYEQN